MILSHEPLHGYPIFCITAVKYDLKGVPQRSVFTGRTITLRDGRRHGDYKIGAPEAREDRADAAGALPAANLLDCPSAAADGWRGARDKRGAYIVIGLYHDPGKPELDLWEPGLGTPGDRILAGIGKDVVRWLQENHGTSARIIPYQIEDGGIYLKDAACLAGIGRMGRNNLVIVPRYGPRVRFRAVWADLDCPEPDQPGAEDPCRDCPGCCISACPMDAFASGRYERERCMARMNADKASGRGRIDHCRACELACREGL